jgi:ribosomal protein S18 acetylase RimI-like enzyme
MLTRVGFDPFSSPSPDVFVRAHVLLSEARGTHAMQDTGAIAEDFARYIGPPRRGINPLGFNVYKSHDGDIVGLSHLTIHTTTSSLALDALAVDPAHRGKHYGSEILDDSIQTAAALGLAQVSLTVLVEREKARLLYQSRGFRTVAESAHADHMQLNIPSLRQ